MCANFSQALKYKLDFFVLNIIIINVKSFWVLVMFANFYDLYAKKNNFFFVSKIERKNQTCKNQVLKLAKKCNLIKYWLQLVPFVNVSQLVYC